jgi:uncharacterized cupredoxin-like copper-binding protein
MVRNREDVGPDGPTEWACYLRERVDVKGDLSGTLGHNEEEGEDMHQELIRMAVLVLAVGASVFSVACSSDTSTSAVTGATSGDGGSTVDVTLKEFSVAPSSAGTPAGEVTFDLTNEGPDDQHEFVVMKTDLDFTQLPQKADGSVDEDAEGIDVIDEVEAIDPGTTETLTVDLEAGSYALICNIYDKQENEAHYAEGMRAGFTVS